MCVNGVIGWIFFTGHMGVMGRVGKEREGNQDFWWDNCMITRGRGSWKLSRCF